MATSGTTAFTLDLTDIVEEAFERAGRASRSGYDLRTARRSLNLMMIEWASRGVNMWTIEEGTVPLVAGTGAYTLPADVIDVVEVVLRTGTGNASTQNDRVISRISAPTYASIPNKLTQGTPVQMWVQRLRDAPVVNLWPVPDNVQPYALQYWALRRIEDAGNGIETPDVNWRFLPALVAGLAFYISGKIPEGASRRDALKAEYEEQFLLASQEDRERSTLRLVPRLW